MCNGTAIKSVDSHKLLGLVVDEQLTWNLHIDEVCSKVLKRISLLEEIKTYNLNARGSRFTNP